MNNVAVEYRILDNQIVLNNTGNQTVTAKYVKLPTADISEETPTFVAALTRLRDHPGIYRGLNEKVGRGRQDVGLRRAAAEQRRLARRSGGAQARDVQLAPGGVAARAPAVAADADGLERHRHSGVAPMAIPELLSAQRDFSAGELDPEMKRRDDLPIYKAGGRQMRDWRILNSGIIEQRPGRRALYLQTGRVDQIAVTPTQIL
jgi:hypothetical protein